MWNRDFDPDSSSSFDNDSAGTPAAELRGLEDDFQIQPNLTGAKVVHNEKVGFMPYEEAVRPPSSQAMMRAKMNEANRAKLMSRGGGPITVGPKEDIFGKPSDPSIAAILFSNQIPGNNDLRDLHNIGRSEINPQSSKLEAREAKPSFVNDELDEEVLDEGNKIQPVENLANFARPSPYDAPKEIPTVAQEDGFFRQKSIEAKRNIAQPQEFAQPKQLPRPNELSGYNHPSPVPVPQHQHQPEFFKEPVALPKEVTTSVKDMPYPVNESAPVQEMPAAEKQYSVPANVKEVPQPSQNAPQDQREEAKDGPRRSMMNSKEILANAMQDMRKFLTTPAPRNVTVQCTIRREKGGFARMFPKYFLHISDGWEFLLAARKRGGNKTSNYMITMNQREFSKKSPHYLAKVRSNFMGTEFHAYDTGFNPNDKKANNVNTREELMVALYKSNILGSKGPRKMRVILPAVNSVNDRHIWKPMKKEESLIENYKKGNTNGMHTFFNKPPKWSEHVQAFVLNFNGRVDRASVKNFQLIDDNDENKVYLQFGRVGDQHFNIDFSWPLSPVQAFAIALTSFDNKFACE